MDKNWREFLIMELKRRGLSIEGTTRVLQNRFDEALRIEALNRQADEALNRQADAENDVSQASPENEIIDKEEKVVETKENYEDEDNEDLFKDFHKPIPPYLISNSTDCISSDSNEFISESVSEVVESISDSSEQEKANDQEKENTSKLKEEQNESQWNEKGEHLHKIYVGNFPYRMVEKDLMRLFRQFGNILDINVPRKGVKSEGFGFILFEKKTRLQMLLILCMGL